MVSRQGGKLEMRGYLIILLVLTVFAIGTPAQEAVTFTGTAVIYGSGFNTRTTTRNFTFRLSKQTSDQEATRLVEILQDDGQDGLLKAIDNRKVGSFALGSQVARDVNAAYVTEEDGKTRIRAIFARWLGFGELRGGYRSRDYPFSYVEIVVDPRTGKGEGTFIPAARIRYRSKGGKNDVEIEDFGTYPGRLMGVQMRGRLSL